MTGIHHGMITILITDIITMAHITIIIITIAGIQGQFILTIHKGKELNRIATGDLVPAGEDMNLFPAVTQV